MRRKVLSELLQRDEEERRLFRAAFDRHAMAFERLMVAFDRHEQAFERHEEGFERVMTALDRHEERADDLKIFIWD